MVRDCGSEEGILPRNEKPPKYLFRGIPLLPSRYHLSKNCPSNWASSKNNRHNPMVTIREIQAEAEEAHPKIPSIRVAIVDAMQGTAQMLYHFCHLQWGLQVVSFSHTSMQAQEEIIVTKPDLILLDPELLDTNGIVLIRTINSALPAARVIVISAICRDYQLYGLSEVEIHGFVDKLTDGVLNLRQAIALVSRGGTYFSPRYLETSRRLRRSETAFFKLLSPREQEVLLWIAQSLSDDEIAVQLNLSVATAKTHRREIMRKLDVPNTPKLIRYGLELGIGVVETKNGISRVKTRQSSGLD